MNTLTLNVLANCMEHLAAAQDVEYEQAGYKCGCGWSGAIEDTELVEQRQQVDELSYRTGFFYNACPDCGEELGGTSDAFLSF